jgi:hypothetical protein
VTWQLLASAGADGWWRRISPSSSAGFFNGGFVFAYFLCLWECRANIGDENWSIVGTAVLPLLDFSTTFVMVSTVHIVGIVRVHNQNPKP